MSDYKKVAKLKGFFREELPAFKRLKTLHSWQQGCLPEERMDFNQQHHQLVYNLILDALQKFDYEFSIKKEGVDFASVHISLECFSKLLEDIPDKLRKRWQNRSILNQVSQLLDYSNDFSLRLRGFEILIKLIDTVNLGEYSKMDNAQIRLLQGSFNFLPFCIGSDRTKSYFESLSIRGNDSFNYAKTAVPQTESQTVELCDMLFNFILSLKEKNFSFWMQLLRENFFYQLYPLAYVDSLGKTIDTIRSYSFDGFRPQCPHLIQQSVVKFFHQVIKNKKYNALLWEADMSIKLCIEIFRQACSLPIMYVETIKQAVSIYEIWTQGKLAPSVVVDDLQGHIRLFVESMFSVFEMTVDSSVSDCKDGNKDMDFNISQKLAICELVLQVFRGIVHRNDISLTEQTWERLLSILLSATNLALHSTFFEKHMLVKWLSDSVIDTLFDSFIVSNVNSLYIWEALQEKVLIWIKWRPFLALWKAKLKLVTQNLADLIIKEGERVVQDTLINSVSDFSDDNILKDSECVSESQDNLIKVYGTWDHFLHLLGNPLEIEEVEGQIITIDAIIEACSVFVDQILKSRTKTKEQKLASLGKKKSEASPRDFLPRANTMLSIFGPWLFQVCCCRDRVGLSEIRAKAFALLGRIFCIRFDEPIEMAFLTSFYQLIHDGLILDDSLVKHAIFLSCHSLFSLDLPGANILLLDFISIALEILNPGAKSCNSQLKKSALMLLYSLVSYPFHYQTLVIPSMSQSVENDFKFLASIKIPKNYSDIRELIFKGFALSLENTQDEEVQSLGLWGICLLIHTDLGLGLTPNSGLEYISTIVAYSSFTPSSKVALTAIEACRSLATRFDELLSLNTEVIETLFRSLCNNGVSMTAILVDSTKYVSKNVESILTQLIYAILDLSMAIPVSFFSDSTGISADVFNLLNTCIDHFSKRRDEILNSSSQKSANKGTSSSLGSTFKSANVNELKNRAPTLKSLASKIEQVAQSEVPGDMSGNAVYGAIVTTVLHLLNRFNNHPLPGGADHFSSLITELNDPDDDWMREKLSSTLEKEPDDDLDDSRQIHLVYQNFTLLSLLERVEVDLFGRIRRNARIIIRDMTGKYVWDFKMITLTDLVGILFDDSADLGKTKSLDFSSFYLNEVENTIKKNKLSSTSLLSSTELSEVSQSYEDAQFESTGSFNSLDLLSRSLEHVANMFKDASFGASFLNPLAPNDTDPTNISQIPWINLSVDTSDELNVGDHVIRGKESSLLALQKIENYIEQERRSFSLQARENKQDVNRSSEASLQKNADTVCFDQCRLILSHLSIISSDSSQENGSGDQNATIIIENSDDFQRSLKLLDQTSARECHKVGVLYVANGQDQQRAVLQNVKGSDRYESFINNLGWNVDFSNHQGYAGGLDPRYHTGNTAPYWCDSTTEIIFHVASRMPTNPSDPQQIHKKRHIGNDHVHIIWSEHSRDYQASTISSDFNDAHIIIYPLKNGLYRIQIHVKDKYPSFGPLQNNSVVSEQNLVVLVRQTALNACRAIRYSKPAYDHPYPVRKRYIDDIIRKYSQPTSSLQFLGSFYSRSRMDLRTSFQLLREKCSVPKE